MSSLRAIPTLRRLCQEVVSRLDPDAGLPPYVVDHAVLEALLAVAREQGKPTMIAAHRCGPLVVDEALRIVARQAFAHPRVRQAIGSLGWVLPLPPDRGARRRRQEEEDTGMDSLLDDVVYGGSR